ncbi:alanine--tRNA ligase [Patescibacteria group bacterium]
MVSSGEIIKKYLKFFEKKGHKIIPSAPLVPENDPSVLFTTAGMHPLVPYLLGETHPQGKRLANNQICLRTDDIDEVGDNFHHTFLEMLGNWSLGDYWKKESITWSYEFLVRELGFDKEKIWVTCFGGDTDAPKDTESASVWGNLGIPKERIVFLPKKDNWWGPAGEIGPCGPDSEIFYDTSEKPCGMDCKPGDSCGRFIEIWNNVFMQYNKTKEGRFEALEQKNIDTGMGVDRTTTVANGLSDNYEVKDLWWDIILAIEETSGKKYENNTKAFRIIADHVRASVFIASEDIYPSNKERGYVLRRLIRRVVRYGKMLGKRKEFLSVIGNTVINNYSDRYPRLSSQKSEIIEIIAGEEVKFRDTLSRGEKEIEKIDKLDGKLAFYLYESYGFPLELTEEIAKDRGQKVNKEEFKKEFEKHKKLSRTASAGMFKGGLADHSEATTKLHTTTHLLHAALRKILGEGVSQKGSNITAERLRFDFSYPNRLTDDQLKKVEDLVNEQVDKDLKVSARTMTYQEALRQGALHFFDERYSDKVKVYKIDGFSKEICGGPHVKHTSQIGHVRIFKQEKIGSGIVRIYAKISI